MWTCVICRFEVNLDDAVAPTQSNHCVCLRCYARETESARSISNELRSQLNSLLSVVEPVESL